MRYDKKYRQTFTEKARRITSTLTLEEKTALMAGSSDMTRIKDAWFKTGNYSFYPYTSAGCPEHGVPGIRFSDGPRGAVLDVGKSTCFPSCTCRGASFDTSLERSVGAAIAAELRSYGADMFGGVCVNLPYHPGWGRYQEVYGEDSCLLGTMGAALVEGVQSRGVMACVKHFAFNSIEDRRFTADVDCDPRAEQEVFLPHFKDCIDAGAACVMTAYNRFRSEYCGHSTHLIRDVLRTQWGFDGIVTADWFYGIRDTAAAIKAGVDLEMPVATCYGRELAAAVRSGRVPEELVDEAVLRIIRTVLAFAEVRRSDPGPFGPDVIGCRQHTQLALNAARKGITLLKNDGGVLPLRKKQIRRLAVIGELAGAPNLGDHGSGQVFPAYAVSPLDGLSRLLPQAEIVCYTGRDPMYAAHVARHADAVVLVAGFSYRDEGEYSQRPKQSGSDAVIGGDRSHLRLHRKDIALIDAVAPVNPRLAVVLIGGGPITMSQWIDQVPAVLMAYYPGQEGGRAIAEILFGEVNPGGRLPFTIPMHKKDLQSVQPDSDRQHYDYLSGYTRLEHDGIRPLFPFGFGLSYTTFAVTDAAFTTGRSRLTASCTVTNTGSRTGDAVIQLYVGCSRSAVPRPHKQLRGFTRVTLRPGQQKTVRITCPLAKLSVFDPDTGTWLLEHQTYELYIGTSSADGDLLKGELEM